MKINTETLTKAICNKGFSGNSSILPRIKFRVTLQGSSPQSLTAYSLNRCSAYKKRLENEAINHNINMFADNRKGEC